MKKQQKTFLLILPLIVIFFLVLVFLSLGGGKDREKSSDARLGLNPELPKANFNPKSSGLDKQSAYEKAGQDSMLRKKYQQQDAVYALPSFKDSTADELQQKLAILQQSLVQPIQPRSSPAMPPAQIFVVLSCLIFRARPRQRCSCSRRTRARATTCACTYHVGGLDHGVVPQRRPRKGAASMFR